MKIRMSIWAGVALLALAQAAQAVPPKVSGRYAVMIFVQCEARFTAPLSTYLKPPAGAPTSGPAVSAINPSSNGELSIGVGNFTFSVPAAGASAGNANLNLGFVGADVLRINSAHAVGTHAENHNGTFSIADTSPPAAPNTTFTFRFDPNPPGPVGPPMTFTMRAGDFQAGAGSIARTLYMVRREDAQCLNAITATKQ